MVSKARLDLPDPESPVTTTSLSRGISTSIFLRLCTRAPRTAMEVRAARTALELIWNLSQVNECQFLYHDVTQLSKFDRSGNFADQTAVREILAGHGDSADVVVPLEVVLQFGSGSSFGHLAQMLKERFEDGLGTLFQVAIDG